jgi:hypothetical protein
MKGDFSGDRFDSRKHFNRVLKQQGRVDLDADWNEQVAIWQHQLRTLIVDLCGPYGGPRDHCGFGIVDWNALPPAEQERLQKAGLKPELGDFLVDAGRYYVDGLLVENEEPLLYVRQPDWQGPKMAVGKVYLAYLDVWERHITYIEDDSIREKALGGPDTTTRVKVTWQVKLLDTNPGADGDGRGTGGARAQIAALEAKLQGLQAQLEAEQQKERPNSRTVTRLNRDIPEVQGQIEALRASAEQPDEVLPAAEQTACDALLNPLRERQLGRMRARVEPVEVADDPCVLPPESRYRGLENHLYRVEVHRSSDNTQGKPPSFKWSRENGSVVTRWLGTEGTLVRVASARGFEAGHWVELTDDRDELQGEPGRLARVVTVEGNTLTIEAAPAWSSAMKNPKVRRWDQQANDEVTLDEGAIPLVPGTGEQGWVEIEDGIEVQFTAGLYRTGDYWLIPARVVTGDIEWPTDNDGEPHALPPHGIQHHYAPLARVQATANDPFMSIQEDCRCRFAPLPCLAIDQGR